MQARKWNEFSNLFSSNNNHQMFPVASARWWRVILEPRAHKTALAHRYLRDILVKQPQNLSLLKITTQVFQKINSPLVIVIVAVLNLKVRVFKISPLDVNRLQIAVNWVLVSYPSLFKCIIINNSMTQHLPLLFSSTFGVLHIYMYMCIKCNYSERRCPSWPLYSG